MPINISTFRPSPHSLLTTNYSFEYYYITIKLDNKFNETRANLDGPSNSWTCFRDQFQFLSLSSCIKVRYQRKCKPKVGSGWESLGCSFSYKKHNPRALDHALSPKARNSKSEKVIYITCSDYICIYNTCMYNKLCREIRGQIPFINYFKCKYPGFFSRRRIMTIISDCKGLLLLTNCYSSSILRKEKKSIKLIWMSNWINQFMLS